MDTIYKDQRIAEANDRVQQAATIEEAKEYLDTLPLWVIRGIADLNYCDAEASRKVMIRDILEEKA